LGTLDGGYFQFLRDKNLCDLTNINTGDLSSTYLVYDPLRGCFADYLQIGAPISVRPSKFLIYQHIGTCDKDCFGLKPLIRKLHRSIASAWPKNLLVPYGYSTLLGPAFVQNKNTLDLKGKCKSEDSDREIEYLGRYTSTKARKNKCLRVEVDEDKILDLCSD
jgi:hypothetical protein